MKISYLAITLILGLFVSPCLGDTDCKVLRQFYLNDNNEFFADRLPKDTEIRARKTEDDVLAETNYINNRFIITFNTKYNLGENHEHLILLHEECHIVTWSYNTDTHQHPKEWKKCMRRLRDIGAFDKILIEGFE